MVSLRISLLVFFLICVVPRQSDGSFLGNLRKLAEGDHIFKKTIDQMSPSPSPVPGAYLETGIAQSPVNPLKLETCDEVADKCDIKDYKITACVPFVGNGSQASIVFVVNAGANSHKLNIVVYPVNITMNDIIISGQEVNKVNLPPNTGLNSSILLNVENTSCAIHTGALIPESFRTDYLTPINGVYIFFVAALFIGVMTWTCCKLVKKKRHLDGVPYQELELEQQEEPSPSFVIETSDGWDQNWDDDDDWDEEKAVRSPGAIKKGLQNSSSLKYVDTTQWGNDWDD